MFMFEREGTLIEIVKCETESGSMMNEDEER